MTPTLNWSTLEGLVELGIMIVEDQQKRFAYLMILTIFQTQLIYLLQTITIGEAWFMVLNMKLTTLTFLEIRWNTYTNTMYHVLSVMFLPELELSWCLLKLSVHHPGPESTMAT